MAHTLFFLSPFRDPSGQFVGLKPPLKPTGSSTSAPPQRAGRAEADPPREGEQGRRDPPKGLRWGDKHSRAQPSRGARPGASPPRTRHRTQDTPSARRSPRHPHRDSSDPEPLTGTGAAAPASLLRPLPQQHPTPAATPVSCITNLPPSHSLPAPGAGHAPAQGMPGVVVPSRRGPAPPRGRPSALELQLPGASAANRPLTGSNTQVVRRQSPLALFLPGLSGREEALGTEVEAAGLAPRS